MTFKNEKFTDVGLQGMGSLQYTMYASIAREHYVSARLAIVSSRFYSAGLLMEQSIELHIKALIFLHHGQATWKNRNGHQLRNLLTTETGIPLFQEILGNADYMDLIDNLEKGYNDVRFGEAWISIVEDKLLEDYDRLMLEFISAFHQATGIRGTDTIRVGRLCLDKFKHNLKTNIKVEVFPK